MIHAVLLGLAGASLLWGIYRGIETKWPNEYVGMTQTFGLRFRSTLVRFIGYRFLPHALAVLVVCITTERVTGAEPLAVLAGWICGGVSVVATNLRAAVAPLIRPREFKIHYVGYHVVVILALAVATWTMIRVRSGFEPLVPSPAALLESLWGGALALAGGGFILSFLRSRPDGSVRYGPEYWVQRCERLLRLKALDLAFDCAVRWRVDPMLYRSIMVAEVIQRPRWWRVAEFLAARFGVTLTVGTMQVSSTVAKTEDRAKRVAAHMLADTHGWTVSDGHIEMNWGVVWGAATRQNAEGTFAGVVTEIYRYLLGSSLSVDGFPAVIIEVRRQADALHLRGVVDGARVVARPLVKDCTGDALGEVFDSISRPRVAKSSKWSFALRLPVTATAVGVVVTADDGPEVCALVLLNEGRAHSIEYVPDFSLVESTACNGGPGSPHPVSAKGYG